MIYAALLAAGGLLVAQNHSAPGGNAGHGAHTPPPRPDHCAMGHLPPEQCPPKPPVTAPDHDAPDQTLPDHGMHGPRHAPSASPAVAPPRAFFGPRHAADDLWGAQAMAPSRRQLARANGGMITGRLMLDRLEARIAADGGEHGYVWDAQAFHGGDIDRLVIKSEGEGVFGGSVETAEVQALYSRAVGPFFDFQAGVRFDPQPGPRTHLAVGLQGLAPYMFEVDAALFLSDRGDVTARIKGEYDQRITQRLIVQPRLDVQLAAQDIARRGIGAGITRMEAGLRLRYEFAREFAPYIGVNYEAKLGRTANFARAANLDPAAARLLIGLRAWF